MTKSDLPTRECVITTLAEYQTAFWIEVAREMAAAGGSVSFISFDDNSTRTLRESGFRTYALSREDWETPVAAEAIEKRLLAHGLGDTPFWYAHEKWNFNAWDEAALDRRLYLYLGLCTDALADVKARGARPVMVQELGGFLSVIAAYHAARTEAVDNWFIEPSFFTGRCFWLRNSFAAKRDFAVSPDRLEPEAIAYLDAAVEKRKVVIPLKDSHQYATPFRKVVTIRNARRLAEKIVDKYLRGRRQEFNHLGAYVRRQLGTLVAAFRLRRAYTPLESIERFNYYPLHVPGDMALTLRSPECLDQLALIETIARQLPRGVKLAIKEHPAMIGALGAGAILALLRRAPNVALIDPAQNNYDVMARSQAIVSVNSKSGAEALLLGKRVLVLGDAFYRGHGLTTDLNSAAEVGRRLSEPSGSPVDLALRNAFFSAVWRDSHRGELYVVDPSNIEVFTNSLRHVVEV